MLLESVLPEIRASVAIWNVSGHVPSYSMFWMSGVCRGPPVHIFHGILFVLLSMDLQFSLQRYGLHCRTDRYHFASVDGSVSPLKSWTGWRGKKNVDGHSPATGSPRPFGGGTHELF